MNNILRLLSQPSTYAGFGLLSQVAPVIAANPTNLAAWAGLFAGLAAVLKHEAGSV
ncbi:MAG: hypothetical protein WC825_06005 [Gallionellaceae bacterium]|jgi:hypothetical protein